MLNLILTRYILKVNKQGPRAQISTRSFQLRSFHDNQFAFCASEAGGLFTDLREAAKKSSFLVVMTTKAFTPPPSA